LALVRKIGNFIEKASVGDAIQSLPPAGRITA
jgi:hypothetical protein